MGISSTRCDRGPGRGGGDSQLETTVDRTAEDETGVNDVFKHSGRFGVNGRLETNDRVETNGGLDSNGRPDRTARRAVPCPPLAWQLRRRLGAALRGAVPRLVFWSEPGGDGGGDGDRTDDSDDAEPPAGVETIRLEELAGELAEASILTEDEQLGDLRLTDEFRRDWWRRIERMRDEERALMHLGLVLELDPDELSTVEEETRFSVRHRHVEMGSWPSRAGFVADIALYPTLGEWFPLWDDLDGESRGETLARLRALLEECPSCDGAVHAREQDASDVAIVCVECGDVLVSGSY